MDNQDINTQNKTNKIISSIVFLVFVLVVLFFVYQNKDLNIKETNKTSDSKITPHYVITASEAGQLPKSFPQNFPMESGVKIDNGYNVSSSGNFQATVHFESSNDLDVIFKKYTDFLNKKNGWTVMNILNNKNIKSISAIDSEGTSVLVNVVENSVTKLNQVTISFVYEKNSNN
jgi:hypothetical protein